MNACAIVLEKQLSFSFLGDWKILVAIQWCGCRMATEMLQSPFDGGGMLDNDGEVIQSPSHIPPLSDGNLIFFCH